jgi:hypothetical protein
METTDVNDETIFPPVEPPPLASEFDKLQKSFYFWRSLRQIFGVSIIVVLIASFFSLITVLLAGSVFYNGHWFIVEHVAGINPYFVISLGLNGIVWPIRAAVSSQFRSVAALLSTAYTVAAIGPLLDAREEKDRKTVVLATNGLIALLPHVREGDIVLLNWRQRGLLRKLLYSENTTLVIATLNALEYIGDREALWYIAALTGKASHSFTFPSAASQEVRDAANACYQAIKARVALGYVRATLLRPSMVNSQGAELLRPAVTTDTPPEQLLRSSNADYEG